MRSKRIRSVVKLSCATLLAASINACPMLIGSFEGAITVDGLRRTYLVHVPPTYDESPVPLVMVFHPFTGSGRSMERMTGFSELADREGFIVVYPEGRQRVWNSNPDDPSSIFGEPADDVAFIDALLDELQGQYAIDADRIYIAGASAGGLMTHRAAAELTHRFAAAASVMITLPKAFPDYLNPAEPLPFLMIHGKADPFFPWDGGIVDEGPSRSNEYLSVADSVQYWRDNNSASADAVQEELPDLDPGDGTTAFVRRYAAGSDGAEVILYGVRGGGHTWPGSDTGYPTALVGRTCNDFSATEAIWSFFAQHQR